MVTATRWLVVVRPVASPLLASGTPEVAVTLEEVGHRPAAVLAARIG